MERPENSQRNFLRLRQRKIKKARHMSGLFNFTGSLPADVRTWAIGSLFVWFYARILGCGKDLTIQEYPS